MCQTALYLFCVFKQHTSMMKAWRIIVVCLIEGTPVLTAIYFGFNYRKIEESGSLQEWYLTCFTLQFSIIVWMPLQFCGFWSKYGRSGSVE